MKRTSGWVRGHAWATLAATLVLMTAAAGCTASSGEDDESTNASSDAITDAPLALCSGNGNLRKAPNAASPILASTAGSKVNVYCKTHGVAPQPGWSDLWIGVNLRQELALSYMHVSTLQCPSDVDLDEIRDCSSIAQLPSPPQPPSSSSSSSSSGSTPHAVTLAATIRSANGSFEDSVRVGRTAPGTVSVSGWWTAYDANNREVGHDVCSTKTALYRDSFTGPFSCHGNAASATRFEITYSASAPGTLAR